MTNKPYIYKKKLIHTGMYYIGQHNGKNKNYKGSGSKWLIDYKIYVKNSKKDIITEIIEYVDDCSKLNEREIYWLEYFDAANNPLFYNMSNKTHGPKFHTQETKNKIKNSNSKPKPKDFKKKMSDVFLSLPLKKQKERIKKLNQAKNVPIIQYDSKGTKIKTFPSIEKASSKLNLSRNQISKCCQKLTKFCNHGTLTFRYKNDPLLGPIIKTPHKNTGRIKTKYFIEKIKLSNSKPIFQYDLEYNFIKEWPSIESANISMNKPNSTSISHCCMGRQKTAYSYIWKYKN